MWQDSNQKYSRGHSLTSSTMTKYHPRQVIKLCFALMVVCYTAYVVLLELHSWTYVWQSTVLADYMYSDLRSTCDLNVQKTALRDTSPVYTIHESASNQQQLQQPLKIGIIVLYGKGAVGEWGEDVMKQVLDNRYAYAKLHRYDVINANSVIDSSRPVAWSKLLAVKEYLPKYDYIMYIDMDAVIMEPSITAESLITAANAGSEKSPDIIMQTDWNGPNTGIWFAKNTKWTNDFLQLVWNQKQLVGKTSSNGVSHPFEYEQRAFHYLLDTDIWKSRDLPTYDREKSIEFSTHFVFLPQCAMNSYTLHPLDIKHIHDRKKSQYVDGDFIIHFAGKKGAPKMNLLRYYLEEAEEKFKQYKVSSVDETSMSTRNLLTQW